MSLINLRPMLWTEDLTASVDFYTSMLGFTADEVKKDLGRASMSKDSVALMLSRPDEHTLYDNKGFTGTFYFNTGDVDRLWEELKDKARVCYGIKDLFYGMRKFAIYDNNGYLPQFGQEIAKRF